MFELRQRLLFHQDPSLAAEAEAWQQEVAEAYCRHVQGNAALAADCGRGGGGGGSGPGGASQQAHLDLEDFFWAVATTESRAFGFEVRAAPRCQCLRWIWTPSMQCVAAGRARA